MADKTRRTANLVSSANIFVDIDNDRVGIGTTEPTQKLDISGSLRLREGLYDLYGNEGADGSILVSTGVGVSWTTPFSAGIQGTQGITGSQGTQGITGSQGTQGITGSQGTQGITGSQGTQGITGSQGTIGSQGITGSQGTIGSQGITGSQGTQGITGSQGTQGITGSQGTQGTQGRQGITGSQGATGPIAGSNQQIIFNNNGSAGASSNLTWDGIRIKSGVGDNNFFASSGGNSTNSGNQNTFIGPNSGQSLTSGNNNIFLGIHSGRCILDGTHNFLVGSAAACNLTSGSNNIIIGNCAGCCTSSANNGIFIGQNAGQYKTTGDKNVIIGTNASASSATVSNEVTIYNGTNFARFQGAATAWTFTSDCRDKQNIQDLSVGRYFLRDVKPRKYEWNFRHTESNKGTPAAGFIAQEVLEAVEKHDAHYTNLVDVNDPNQYTLALSNFIPMMVKAIQELDEENQQLKIRVQNLESQVGIATTS
jgi:hypothetical protein